MNQDKRESGAQGNKDTLRQALDEEKNRHLRTLADFDNYRKRVEREVRGSANRGKKELVVDLLPVLDNLERALDQVPGDETRHGLTLVYRQLMEVLRKHGLEPVECLGRPFNPEEHEGIGYVAGTGHRPGHVAEELRRGYRFGKELLRPATVRVAGG